MGIWKDLGDAMMSQHERAAHVPPEEKAPDDERGGFAGGAIGAGLMLTVSGRVFSIDRPKPEMVTVEDLAHHLAVACRWAGATCDHYSVAQHSILVALMVPPELRLAALLHDGHEAYIGDRTRPFKQIMPPETKKWWAGIADGIDRAICQALGVDVALLSHPLIKRADLVALAAEGRDLIARWYEEVDMPHTNTGDPLPDCSYVGRISPLYYTVARSKFLDTFQQYKSCAK